MSDPHPQRPTQPTPGGGVSAGHPTPVIRMLLVALGAGAMAASPFLQWVGDGARSVRGAELGVDAFWSATPTVDPGFVASAGLVVLVIALITLVGLAPGARGFSVLGGIFGVAAAVLVAVSALRGGLAFEHFQVGLYLLFIGGLVALIGGVLPAEPVEEAPPAELPHEEPPA